MGRSGRAVSCALAAATALSAHAVLAQPAPPTPPPPAAATAPPSAVTNPASAKLHLAAGDKAAKASDWTTALSEYQAAMDAQPGALALAGIANAQYALKMQGEAYESYDRFLKDYATGAGAHVKAQAQARLKELAALTGYASIRVSEAGADVSIDGKSIGQSPVAALIRVVAGPHKIDVTKAGFSPVTKTPNVPSNGKEIVDVQLVREATTGHLAVKEKSGQPVRVLVDGADVGAAPIDVEVQPGPHDVVLRSSTLTSPSQKVDVAKGAQVVVELAATAASAHVEVATSDRKGIIFLDAKPVAEGAYSADVSVGAHTLSVTRDGYERYEKTFTLADKESLNETVTLKLPEASTATPVSEGPRSGGVYGGIGAGAVFEPGGEGNELDTGCNQLGAESCATSAPIGGGLMGWVGYEWRPVGVEAFLAGEYDQSTPSATFVGATSSLENPLTVGQPRVEQFGFLRFGGLGAIRARVSAETTRFRFSFAAGFGLSVKDMLLERQTATNSNATNSYVDKDGHAYVSPALSGDLSVAFRTSSTLAIAVGAFLWLESAGSNLTSNPNGQVLLSNGQPLPTPAYHFASGAQVFLGPYVGLQFGP